MPRDLEIEIAKAEELVTLFDNEDFWKTFVSAVIRTNRTEETWWDLKQSLEMWHTAGEVRRIKEEDFCERLAAFANTEGGVVVIGVSNATPRKIVGVQDVENRIKHIYSSVRSHSDLAPPAMKVIEVLLNDEAGASRACLVVGIAKSPAVVSVKDDTGRLSYPIRRGPGMVLSNPATISSSKQFQKGYSWEFLDHLRKIARSSG
jgi:predicted HTH transcriptional regulator